MSEPVLRPFRPGDEAALWAMLQPVFRAGDTYAIDPAIPREEALDYWCGAGREVWMAEAEGRPQGTYYLRANAGGGGAHVCNAGFVTAPDAGGRGIARAMLDHALARARASGYAAMQFNFVIATNRRAIDIWQRAGFEVVGRLPGAFRPPQGGEVDALVMFRRL